MTFPPELARKRDVYLGPYSEPKQTLEKALDEIWEDVFEEELFGWSTNESDWPQNRSREMFDAWFETELADEIIDLVPDHPLTEDDVELFDIQQMARECAWCGAELAEEGGRNVTFALSDPELVEARLDRILGLQIGRDRLVEGVVRLVDPERPDDGANLVVRACSRPCEKHLLKEVRRALRELNEGREQRRRMSDP